MQIKEVEKFKSWLFKKLEPLCDADPDALAKYVVALLKKEKPKSALKELCIDQLEVFLSKETTSFVEKLFRCLESESYLKGEDPPPKTPSPSPPLGNKHMSTPALKEDKEVDDDDRDFRRSRRNEPDFTSSYNPRRVVMTSSSTGGGLGRKRKIQDMSGSTSYGSGVKRRAGFDFRRSNTDSHSIATNASLSDGVSSSTSVMSSVGSGGGPRRPVRERLGPKPEERSDSGRGKRYHRGHSSQSSSSGNSSDCRSDSEEERLGRKRPGRDHSGSGKHSESKKKRRCKDYDEKGFCILGENCPYDHGTDPLVIGGELNPYNATVTQPLGMPPAGIPIPPMSKPYNPPDAYNPEDPGLSLSNAPKGFMPPPLLPSLPLRGPFPPSLPHMAGVAIPPPPSLPLPPLFNSSSTTVTPSLPYPPQPRPRPPLHTGHVPSRPSDTLIIRKVPRDLNTITKLSSHFEKFGTIVNLTVHYEGDPEGALVQFSNHHEAKKAHNSTEAVLNNRFIKIYYLRKDFAPPQRPLIEHSLESPASLAISRIHGGPSQSTFPSNESSHPSTNIRMSASIASESQPGISTTTAPPPAIAPAAGLEDNTEKSSEQTAKSPTSPLPKGAHPKRHTQPARSQPHLNPQQKKRSAEVAKMNLELQKKSQELLHKQIQQQKLLINKLEMSGKHLSAEEKKQIMDSLKTLSGSISKLKEAATKTTVAGRQDTKKDHSPNQPQPTPSTQQQTNLKEKADALRKQAHILGLISSPSQPLPSSGVARSGGPHDLKSKKDTKPRQLIVINVENRDLLTSYFESFGGLERVEVDPTNSKNLIFTFKNSATANQVVKKGSTLNGKPLIMKWYSHKPAQSQVSPTLPTLTATKPTVLPHHVTASSTHQGRQTVEKQLSIDEGAPTTPTLLKPDPSDLHLVEDSDEEESEGRSWRR